MGQHFAAPGLSSKGGTDAVSVREVRSPSIADDRRHLPSRRGRLKQLRAFCQVARIGSVSRAAKQLMSSQPAVSTQIRNLEEALGVPLFKRRGPRLSLNRMGKRLYRLAMPVVHGIDRLPDTFIAEHRGEVSDDLRIGAGQTSAGYLLPPYLERFQERFPKIRIEVKIGTGRQRMEWLRDFEVDLVVGAVEHPPSDVEFTQVAESAAVLITAEDHPLAGRDSVTLEEVASYAFVGHTSDHFIRRAQDVILGLRGVAPNIVVEVDGWGVITNYVAAGAGISFVPDLCLSEHDSLWKIRVEGVIPRRWYGIVRRRNGPLSLAASRFVESLPPAGRKRPVR